MRKSEYFRALLASRYLGFYSYLPIDSVDTGNNSIYLDAAVDVYSSSVRMPFDILLMKYMTA